MHFQSGDEVVVIALNRRGSVIDVQGDRYRVAVGALTVTASERELRLPEGGRKQRKATRPTDRAAAEQDRPSVMMRPTRRIDLHGMTVEAAREAVLSAVNAAALAGDEVLEVVHGIGTGRVRDAVWKELKRLSVVRNIRPHPTNRGVTIVQL
jgi:DNA mismatch repair protein MutS2